MKDLLKSIQSWWSAAFELATWLASLVAGFVFAPPVGVLESDTRNPDAGRQMATFGLTLLVGAIYFLARKKSRSFSRKIWWTLIPCFLLLGAVSYSAYRSRLVQWTSTYNGGLVIHGERLTDKALDYCRREQISLTPLPHVRLLADYAGNSREIWADIDLIESRWRSLFLYYFGSITGFSLGVMLLFLQISLKKPTAAK